jgi:Arc/MetJ family transcription regulator
MPVQTKVRALMRTTIDVDETLLAEAQRLTGQREPAAVLQEGLRALIERERTRRPATVADGGPSAAESVAGASTDRTTPVGERRPVLEVLAEIHAAQEARGYVPRSREEVDRELDEERASWER